MSSGFTPVNQVRMTNVAYVRLQKKGKRFEIACYRNKVVSWRNKIETSLLEVLQVQTVFTNVSKGMLASSHDLIEAFGTADQSLVCKEILDKGEMQVSEQERGALLESIFRDVASIVVEKSINPENNRPYTISMIQTAMRQIHFSASVSKSSKSQALEVIRKLKAVMPIARASMHLRLVCPSSSASIIRDRALKELGLTMPGEDGRKSNTSDGDSSQVDDMVMMEVQVDPEYYRKLEELVAVCSGGKGRVEVLHMRVQSSAAAPASSAATGESKHLSTIASDDEDSHNEEEGFDRAKDISVALKSVSEVANHDNTVCSDGEGDEDDEDVDITSALQNKLLVESKLSLKEKSKLSEESIESHIFGMASKSKQKKKDKKKKQAHDIELMNSDDDDDSDNHLTVARPASSVVAEDKGTKKEPKKGKTAKRIEKQEQLEMEQRALKQKSRLVERGDDTEALPDQTPTQSSTISSSHPSADTAAVATGVNSKSCNTCGGSFVDAAAYRNHFRSEWHRYNLNRKLKNLPTVSSEEEFLKLTFSEVEKASILN